LWQVNQIGELVAVSPTKKSLRQQPILAELTNSPAVRISELAGRFGVSTETARRDIEELSQRVWRRMVLIGDSR